MTVVVVGMAAMLFAFEGTHMITVGSILLILVTFVAALLIDSLMLFGQKPEAGDRLLRYRPILPDDDQEEPLRRRRTGQRRSDRRG